MSDRPAHGPGLRHRRPDPRGRYVAQSRRRRTANVEAGSALEGVSSLKVRFPEPSRVTPCGGRPAMSVHSLGRLTTETANPRSAELDTMPVLDLLTLMNDEDAGVPLAVRAALPRIADAVELI